MSQGKKQPWRPPTTEQDALEKQMSSLILSFLKSGKISSKNYTVAQDAQDKLEQELAQCLQQANALGAQYGSAMVKHQEASLAAKMAALAYFLKRAKNLAVGLIGRVRDAVSKVFSDGGTVSDAEEAVTHVLDYLPDQASATAIHAEVEDAVMAVFDDEDIEEVEVVCEPGACQMCLENQDAGPIKRGEEFPSGHTSSPFHNCCRCNVVPSKGE